MFTRAMRQAVAAFAVLGFLLLVSDAQAATSHTVSWRTVGTSIHSSIDPDKTWPPASFTVAEGDGTFGPASVQMMSGPVEVPVEKCPGGAIKEYDLKASTAVRTFRSTLDQVYLTTVSGLGCIYPDGSVTSESRAVVSGGTGRFENASGDFTTKVIPQTVSFPEWKGEVNSLVSVTEGTIVLQEATMSNHADPDQYEKLWNAGDVEGLAALYTHDSITLQAGGKRLDLEQLRDALPDLTKIRTRGEPVYRVEVGDIALERSRWTSEIPGEDGKIVEATSESYVVFQRQPDGRWLILIDDPGID
ncbi:MAG: nuclear transport factor 2 family protein [Deltaproteobacteria bacterium]|nr:nuclear transport factor 2 family protein [Deltaproteobacteria bacterium]MBW2361769.1 nuclear transport factor 2 family protein [Deltaproteobacteria bacterium]